MRPLAKLTTHAQQLAYVKSYVKWKKLTGDSALARKKALGAARAIRNLEAKKAKAA